MTLIPRLDMAVLDALPLDPSTKGLPYEASALTVGDVGRKGWNLLKGDVPLPAAVIRDDILTANSKWMSAFIETNGLLLSPHGKTTMAPYLFDLQVADGSWAITTATLQQVEVCRRFGVKRVLLANQPVGRQAVDACFTMVRDDEDFELYCLADGPAGLALLADGARRLPPPASNPLRVLVEIGFTGGRTGARTRDEALAVARSIVATPGLKLAGFECFEGLLPTPEAADKLIDDVVVLAELAAKEGLFAKDQPIIVSAGGSAFFDRAGERFNKLALSAPVLRILRAGCYLTHDSIGYTASFRRIQKETSLKLPPGELVAALEVWAYVQSRPENVRAIVGLGRRDVGSDSGMPVPVRWYRPGSAMTAPEDMPKGHEVVGLNDQHCHVSLPADSPLQVGDMVSFGIGHPCTTFDKWSMLLLVDKDYRVTKALKTFF